MNLLVITTAHLFPSDGRPQAGIFFANVLTRLRPRLGRLVVVTPRAYVPRALLRLRALAPLRGMTPHQWWNGIEVFRPAYLSVGSPRWAGLVSRTFALAALPLCKRLHRQHPFDLVLSFGFSLPAYAGQRVARACGVRSAAWAIGSDVNTVPGLSAGNMRLMIRNLRQNDLVLTASEDLRRTLVRFDPAARHVHVFYRGIDLADVPADDKAALRARLGLAAECTYILSAGDVETHKGSDEFYGCFRRLAGARPALRAIWVGSGSQAAVLQQRAREDGLSDRLLLTGSLPRPHLLQYMRAADCFAFASHAEGVPNVVLEAMAAGLPAAATSVGGIPEIIADGVTGLLVPPRDAPALAAAVDRLLRNPDQGARMAGAARAFVRRHFDVDRNAEVLVPLLERVARGESAEGPFPCCAGASAGQLPTITSPDEAA